MAEVRGCLANLCQALQLVLGQWAVFSPSFSKTKAGLI